MVEAAQFPVEHPKSYNPDTGATNWCCAACLMLRTEAFRRLGGFDEKLFLYCEDVDLSWRAWLAGYTCVYAPLAKCVHVSQEEDIGKNRLAEIHHMHLGGLYLRRKWFGEAEVRRYREHLRVWFGDAVETHLVASVNSLQPEPCDRRDHPRITLMPDQIHYAPIRW
jgi:GT2 family glycosyltransferase